MDTAILTPTSRVPGAPLGTANPEHQPCVPTAGGVPPYCTCGFVGGNGSGRPGDRPLLATHLQEHDPTYGTRAFRSNG